MANPPDFPRSAQNTVKSHPSEEELLPFSQRRRYSVPTSQDSQVTGHRESFDAQIGFEDTQHDDEGHLSGASSSVEEPAPMLLNPFFTVMHDTITGEYHHPHVHYVFSDDDPDIITSAVIQSLDRATSSSTSPTASGDRHIIIDLAADGQTVVSAKSLDPEWQVVSSSISAAPTFEEHSNVQDVGLMLRVEGMGSMSGDTRAQDAINRLLRQEQDVTNIDGMTAAMSMLAETYMAEVATLQKYNDQGSH